MKTIDGIWTLEYYGIVGWEYTGILVLESGRCLGGGNNHYCMGTYSESGRKVRIDVDLNYFGSVRTLFGAKDRKFSATFQGKRRGESISGTVSRPDKKVIPLQFRLKRRSSAG